MFSQRFTCADLLDFTSKLLQCTGLSPCIALLSSRFHQRLRNLRANSRSLAATNEISVDFFSSGYLDVSVLPVRLIKLCIHLMITAYAAGFPHSDIVGYNGFYHLTNAFRRLTRPSSPLTAKASTIYAQSLNHTTPSIFVAYTRYASLLFIFRSVMW